MTYSIDRDNYFTKKQPNKSDQIVNFVTVPYLVTGPKLYSRGTVYEGTETDIDETEPVTVDIEFTSPGVSDPQLILDSKNGLCTAGTPTWTQYGGSVEITATNTDKFILTVTGIASRDEIAKTDDVAIDSMQSVELMIDFKDKVIIPDTAVVRITNNVANFSDPEDPPLDVAVSSSDVYATFARVTVTSSDILDGTFTLLVEAKPLDTVKQFVTATDQSSINEYGVLKYEYPENHLIQSKEMAETIAVGLLASYKQERKDLSITWRGNPALELGDEISVPEYERGQTQVLGTFKVFKNSIDFDGTLRQSTDGRKI